MREYLARVSAQAACGAGEPASLARVPRASEHLARSSTPSGSHARTAHTPAPHTHPKEGQSHMWYVIQTTTGRENTVLHMIMRAVSDYATRESLSERDIVEECFSPRYRTAKKVDGVYVPTEELLLPGYLIAITDNPATLEVVLRNVPALSKILKNENAFTPLTDAETAWICAFTQKGDRVVDMSEGFKEGGRVVVTSGPLVGHEGLISRINRRKHLAYLQISMLGRNVEVKVGFNLVKKRE